MAYILFLAYCHVPKIFEMKPFLAYTLIPLSAGSSLSAVKEQKWPISGRLGPFSLWKHGISHIPLGI